MNVRWLCYLLAVLCVLPYLCAPAWAAPSPDEQARLPLLKAQAAFEKSDYTGCLKTLAEILTQSEKKGDRQLSADVRLLRARVYLELRFYRKAADDARLAKKDYEALQNKAGVFSCETVVLEYLKNRNRNLEAWQAMRRLEKELPSVKAPAARADFYLARGTMLMKTATSDLAEKNFYEALKLSRALKDSGRCARASCNLALLWIIKKDYAKAAGCCRQAIDEAEASGSPHHVALLLQACASLADKQGRRDEAFITCDSALTICRLDGNRGFEARILMKKANLFMDTGDWESFNSIMKKTAALCSRAENWEEQMDCCHMAAELLTMAPKSKAERYEFLVMMQDAASRTGDPYEVAWAVEKEADSLLNKDQGKAIEVYTRARKLYADCRDRPGELRAMVQTGYCLITQGRPDEALECLNKALPFSEELDRQGGADDGGFVSEFSPGAICRKAGMACLANEHYHEALGYFEKALAYDSGEGRTMERITDRQGILLISIQAYDIEKIKEEVSCSFREAMALKEPYQRVSGYNIIVNALLNSSLNVGSSKGYDVLYSRKDTVTSHIVKALYEDQHLYRQMLSDYKEWISLGKDAKNPFEEGIPYMLLGFFYFTGEKNTEAHDAFEKSLECFEKGHQNLFAGIVQLLIGMTYIHENRKGEAVKCMEESVQKFAQMGDRKNAASVGSFLGLLYRDLGRMDEALAWYEKSLRVARETGNRRLVSSLLVGTGYTHFVMKQPGEAEKCYKEALALQQESNNRREQALTWLFLGRLEESRQNVPGALEYYGLALKGFKALEKLVDVRDVALEEGTLLEKIGKGREALKVYLEALDMLVEVRSRIGEKNLHSRQSEDSRKLFERAIALLIKEGRHDEALKYFSLSGSYDLFSNVDLASIDMRDEKMKKLVGEMQELSRKMQLLQSELESGQKPDRENKIAGELASTKQQFLAVTNEIKAKNPDYGQMIAIQSPELAQLQPVIPADTVLLQYYPSEEGLYIFVVTRDSYAIRQVEVPRARLYELVRELRASLEKPGGEESASYKKARQLLYTFLLKPVLPEIESKNALEIIPSGLLWYVPFEVLGDKEKESLVERKAVGYLFSSNIVNMLAAIKKTAAAEGKLVAFGNPEGADLPAAGEEVLSIGKLYPSSLVMTGKEATLEAFRKSAPLGTYLHIATHSILNRDDINSSYIQFAGEGGHFSLGEIYGLSLPQAQLVVLSSCQSALGSDNPGREFASLASAFTVAGAPSVIASLWKVNDTSTGLLFNEFYRNLKKGMGKSEALRQAKCALREKQATASPHFWSPFILLGDWR